MITPNVTINFFPIFKFFIKFINRLSLVIMTRWLVPWQSMHSANHLFVWLLCYFFRSQPFIADYTLPLNSMVDYKNSLHISPFYVIFSRTMGTNYRPEPWLDKFAGIYPPPCVSIPNQHTRYIRYIGIKS